MTILYIYKRHTHTLKVDDHDYSHAAGSRNLGSHHRGRCSPCSRVRALPCRHRRDNSLHDQTCQRSWLSKPCWHQYVR